MDRRSSPAKTGQDANALAKEVNVLLKLVADKSGKYKQLSVELVKAAQEDVSASFASMLKRRPSGKTGLACYAEAIHVMLKVLAGKSEKQMLTHDQYKQLSDELAQTAFDEMKNVMESLANGKQMVTAVEMRELILATKDEIAKKGLAVAFEFSAMPEREKALGRHIAGDESLITRVPQWPKNKDELFHGYNDTWDCFKCANGPRKVTRTQWKVARAQVCNGIFYPIESASDLANDLADYEVTNIKLDLGHGLHISGNHAEPKAKNEMQNIFESLMTKSGKKLDMMTVKELKEVLQTTKFEMTKMGLTERYISLISSDVRKLEQHIKDIAEDTPLTQVPSLMWPRRDLDD